MTPLTVERLRQPTAGCKARGNSGAHRLTCLRCRSLVGLT